MFPVSVTSEREGREGAEGVQCIPVPLGESELCSYLDVGVEGWLFGIHLAGMTLTLRGHACVPVCVCVCVCIDVHTGEIMASPFPENSRICHF